MKNKLILVGLFSIVLLGRFDVIGIYQIKVLEKTPKMYYKINVLSGSKWLCDGMMDSVPQETKDKDGNKTTYSAEYISATCYPVEEIVLDRIKWGGK